MPFRQVRHTIFPVGGLACGSMGDVLTRKQRAYACVALSAVVWHAQNCLHSLDLQEHIPRPNPVKNAASRPGMVSWCPLHHAFDLEGSNARDKKEPPREYTFLLSLKTSIDELHRIFYLYCHSFSRCFRSPFPDQVAPESHTSMEEHRKVKWDTHTRILCTEIQYGQEDVQQECLWYLTRAALCTCRSGCQPHRKCTAPLHLLRTALLRRG
jgi:hypothetical protein